MKILIVTDTIFPDEGGGLGRMSWEQARRLQKLGHKVVILTRNISDFPEEEIKENVKIFRYKFNFSNPFLSLKNCKNLANDILNKNKFDIIASHSPFSAFGTLFMDKKNKIPYIYNFYSPWPEEYEIRHRERAKKNIFYFPFYKIGILLRKIIEGKVLRKCKKIIVLSKFMFEKLIHLYRISPEKIELIFGAVDTEKFSPSENKEEIRKNLNLLLDIPILLTVRNLLPRMGIENLIFAIYEIVKRGYNLILLIIGKGFLEKKLKNLVIKLELQKYIKFLGFVEDEKLPLYYKVSDLFILPTKYLEGFGLVTIEALSSGLPVLGTPVGATPEILGKIDKNLIFEDTTPSSMAKLIIKYLENPLLIENLKEKCRNFVLKNYTWDLYIKKIEEIYSAVSKMYSLQF